MAKKISVAIIEKEVSPIVKEAESIKIVDAKSMEEATVTLSRLNIFNDKLTVEKKKLTDPLQEALREVRSRYVLTEKIVKTAIDLIRGKMTVYQTKEIDLKNKEELKIIARVGVGIGKISLEHAVNKIDAINRAIDAIVTEYGRVKFKEKMILRIKDISKIPREYLVVDEDRLLSDLKSGKNVEGACMEIVQIPLNYR